MFSNALVDLYGGLFNVRGDVETIGWMIENKWKDEYKDGWWTSAKDKQRVQVVVDGSIPHGELHYFGHRGFVLWAYDMKKSKAWPKGTPSD